MIFNFFLHDIVKILGILIKKIVKFCLNCSNFKLIVNKLRFSSFWSTNQWNKDSIFCKTYLVQSLGQRKMYPAALHKIPTQTVDSSQVFEKWIVQKQSKMIKKKMKSWDRPKITDLEQVCLKEDQDFLSWLLSSKTFLPGSIQSSRSVICFVSSTSQNKCYMKNHVELKELNR